MLPRTFLTHLLPARIAEATRRLEAKIWQPDGGASAQISVWQTEPSHTFRTPAEIADSEFAVVPAVVSFWGPKYSQRWYRLRLPEQTSGAERTRYLVWMDQAEATAWIDGVPYSGLDLAHPYMPIPHGVDEFLVEAVCVRTGIWLDGSNTPLTEEGSRYTPPQIAWRDDDAWHAWHDLTVLLELLECEHRDNQPVFGTAKRFTDPIRYTAPAFRASPLYRRLCVRLDEAVDVLDFEGVAAFRKALQEIYADFRSNDDSVKAVLTGHAHIDLVWLWPEHVGERKAVHSLSTQLRLLNEYPEFRFGYSQPASYEAVRRISPQLYAKVKERIAEGVWDATGASYVECDTMMPCGEALLRNLRIGQKGFRELRDGSEAKVFWLPDVFGYSGCMPQLLRSVGVDGFFTTKLSWSTVNRFPHTSFRWRGADGSEVTSHMLLLHDYNEAVNMKNIREDALHHQQSAVHGEFLQPNGYGDGGGGPTEIMIERARRMNDLAGVPQTQWGSIEPFFERLHAVRDRLPVVAGDLILELHRGVFTTHGNLKSAFRALERSLQVLEAAHAVMGKGAIDEHYWRRASFTHFHDYIPGSSIWEVYAQALPELAQLAQAGTDAAQKQLVQINGASAQACVFNPLPVERMWANEGVLYRIAPLSGTSLKENARIAADVPAAVCLENGSVELRSDRVYACFDAQGRIVALRVDDCEVALGAEADRFGALAAYADNPAAHQAWDLDRGSLVTAIPASVTAPVAIETDAAQLRAAAVYTLKAGRNSTVRVSYSLSAGESALRICYDIDWQDPLMCLKAIFPTGYRGQNARYGAPFGSALRGQWPGYPREEANWELPASRWMAMTDDAQQSGLAIVTKDRFGFSAYDGVVGVSLLRSAFITEADYHLKIREGDRPVYSDIGQQRVEIALTHFNAGSAASEQPAVLADTLFTPCFPYSGTPCTAGLLGVEGAPSLTPSWAEPVDDGWVLRLHETLGRQGNAVVRIDQGWQAQLHALDGTPLGEACSDSLNVPFGPYKVLSVRFFKNVCA